MDIVEPISQLMVATVAAASCGLPGKPPLRAPPAADSPLASECAATAPTRITGVRHSWGNAVDCPKIRTDAGALVPVSGFTGDIALGQRVTITGRWGFVTSCRGRVLVIEKLVKG